jgi:cysteinyl-tRNA synthetase
MSRIETFIEKAIRRLGKTPILGAAELRSSLPAAFVQAMDEDLAMPAALAAVHDEVRAGNSAIDSANDAALASSLSSVLAMTSVLGINPLDWEGARQPHPSSHRRAQCGSRRQRFCKIRCN